MSTYELHDLILKAKNNSDDAKIAIIEKFSPIISKYSYKLGYEDAKQDLILFVLTLIPKIPDNFKEDAQLVSYIAKAVYCQYIKLSKSYCAISNVEIYSNDFFSYIPSNFQLSNVDNSVFIENLLSKLSKYHCQIIYLHYIEGYSIQELADYYHLSRQAVNKAKNSALKILKNECSS